MCLIAISVMNGLIAEVLLVLFLIYVQHNAVKKAENEAEWQQHFSVIDSWGNLFGCSFDFHYISGPHHFLLGCGMHWLASHKLCKS